MVSKLRASYLVRDTICSSTPSYSYVADVSGIYPVFATRLSGAKRTALEFNPVVNGTSMAVVLCPGTKVAPGTELKVINLHL